MGEILFELFAMLFAIGDVVCGNALVGNAKQDVRLEHFGPGDAQEKGDVRVRGSFFRCFVGTAGDAGCHGESVHFFG